MWEKKEGDKRAALSPHVTTPYWPIQKGYVGPLVNCANFRKREDEEKRLK